MKTIVLASSSPYRRALLDKLGITYQCQSPDIDESALDQESAAQLVERLAIAKAQAIAPDFRDALIIGSDQVCVINEQILGKPHNHDNAMAQLRTASGQTVRFYTGLAVIDSQSQQVYSLVEPFDVVFKTLTDADIDWYLRQEQPYNCAGSFKSEGLGIMLFERLSGRDPNGLIGLPLISLLELLGQHGYLLREQSTT